MLRDPVITTYALKEKPNPDLPLAGATSLSHYSLRNEDPFPSFAIEKKIFPGSVSHRKYYLPQGEAPVCIVQEIGYRIPFADGTALDPLTAALSLEKEKSDPRISKAADEMLEEHVWSKASTDAKNISGISPASMC